MTATTAQAPTRPARPPHLAFTGLCWVTWRQHRTALLAILAVFVFSALVLVYYGLSMHRDFTSLKLAACAQVPGSEAGSVNRDGLSCANELADFHGDQNRVSQLMAAFLPLPAVFGLFIGAPLLAREYESGTFRFTFTQGAGRTRWLATKISVLTAFTIATATAFTAVVMWWYAPLVPLDGRIGQTGIPEIYGAVFVARAVFALAVGILAGAALRRVVPAIGVSLVAWIAVVVLSITTLRAHLLTPLTAVDAPQNPSGWIVSDVWKSPTGTVLNSSQVAEDLYKASAAGHKFDGAQYLYQHGYVHTVVYQPASRFWALQGIEAGGLVVLSAALLLAALWLVRRRAA
jgi:ABC-type transport system involved in multi-copper enzyme maturation permease subunit